MKALLERIERYADTRPEHPALADEYGVMSYAVVQREIARTAQLLGGRRVGLMLDNGCPWVIVDLALRLRGAVCVPMPLFFSNAQLSHVIEDAGLDMVITDHSDRLEALLQTPPVMQMLMAGRRLSCFELGHVHAKPMAPDTVKVTYTSGTTGAPKGVCLTGPSLERVTLSLCRAVDAGDGDRTLSLLPLSTLLENIGGVYAALASGACAQVPGLAEGGIGGTSLPADKLFNLLHRFQPTSIILVPQQVKEAVEAMESGARLPSSLRFAAVGGAPLSAALLERARVLGLPAFQGYGLSEASSVVSLNLPGADKPDSVGRPLPHAGLRVADDGEIVVSGALFHGYLGAEPLKGNEWSTGDLGRLDPDGFLYITGRKKTAFATAYGRKIAPEWVERELLSHSAVAQAAVFGEARPFNVAVIVPRGVAALQHITDAVAIANERLPDYARVTRWVIAAEPFTAGNGLGSHAGTVNRNAVAARYAGRLNDCYTDSRICHGVL
jgi:long-chain acyl-CoA synthetase